jgi:hypothetical protein
MRTRQSCRRQGQNHANASVDLRHICVLSSSSAATPAFADVPVLSRVRANAINRSSVCFFSGSCRAVVIITSLIRSNLINTSTRLALRSVEAIWQHARDPIRSCRHTGGSHCGSSSGEVCCAKCSVFARASPRISMRRHALQALVHACKKALCKRRTVRS